MANKDANSQQLRRTERGGILGFSGLGPGGKGNEKKRRSSRPGEWEGEREATPEKNAGQRGKASMHRSWKTASGGLPNWIQSSQDNIELVSNNSGLTGWRSDSGPGTVLFTEY